jgi:hypothetical protein
VLTLGADGCDPLLRAVDAADLPAALEEVPALLADAEARWAEPDIAQTSCSPRQQRSG